MKRKINYRSLVAAILLIAAGCAHHQRLPQETLQAVYAARGDQKSLLVQHAPLFLVHDYRNEYNRIGRPSARYGANGEEDVYVDPRSPVFYFFEQAFTTAKGSYMNLVYRVHFSGTPYRLIPFYLTAGRNVGLMVVITLDARKRPVLVSTVHTCGCYLAITPTDFLPGDAFPPDWKEAPVGVYGEVLPGMLAYRGRDRPRLMVRLRPGVHRVMGLEFVAESTLDDPRAFKVFEAPLEPVSELERIRLGDGFTSFYYTDWPLKGHVKGSLKPFESVLLSLPSLDLFVGADKVYADREKTGNPFYTSLKPWNRNASDMFDFDEFLKFWGWRL